jgi:site-specific recombinase XerD
MSPTRKTHSTGTPRKSPLRVATLPRTGLPEGIVGLTQVPARRNGREAISAADLRKMAISDFTAWLRTQLNKHHRPYQEQTIIAYRDAAQALDRWMTAEKVNDDFTACDTAMLNRFFADYFASHTQGGTNTHQRNLAHLFIWLEKTQGLPTPYTAQLNRYAPQTGSPSTLASGFIEDLLEVTGGGRSRSFEDTREHAIIRTFTDGVRLTELSQIHLGDLSAGLITQPFTRVVPLKGARESGEGRLVPLAPKTARAIIAYLRARQSHRYGGSLALWLGTRNRGPISSSGVYQMLGRRSIQAGYDPSHPHQFRHTFVNDQFFRRRLRGGPHAPHGLEGPLHAGQVRR